MIHRVPWPDSPAIHEALFRANSQQQRRAMPGRLSSVYWPTMHGSIAAEFIHICRAKGNKTVSGLLVLMSFSQFKIIHIEWSDNPAIHGQLFRAF